MTRSKYYSSKLPKTALRYVLKAMIPYTEANLKLTFKPNAFFNDLERIDQRREYSRSSLRRAYYRAKSEGYISMTDDGLPYLTDLGKALITPHVPKLLENSSVMVIFDIPENLRYKRRFLRSLLRELKFRRVQQSVWVSHYDCKEILESEFRRNSLEKYTQVYEVVRIV